LESKISPPSAPTRSGCKTPLRGEALPKSAAGRGACGGWIFHANDYRSIFGFEQDIVDKFGNSAFRVSPRLPAGESVDLKRRLSARTRATAPCLAFARAGATEAGEARSHHRRPGRGRRSAGSASWPKELIAEEF
jgi:hypothetical protein